MGHNESQKKNVDGGYCPVLEKLPKKLRDRLLPFQREGVRFAAEKNGRCLIADEMGLGKTIQAISVAYIYKDEWPLLIVVPSSLKFCWIEELEKWLPDILPHEINLVHSGGDISGMSVCPITIITYGLLRLPSNSVIREALAARQFQVVICDESHYLKNSNTLSCKTVVPLLKSAKRRILLSGTPALARPVELYSQVDAICPGLFGSYWQYTDRYCDARTVYFGKFRKRQVNGASNLSELQHKLQTMMIRREKSDVLTELPPKQRQRILFELKNSPLKKDILEMFAELKQKIRQGGGQIQTVLQADLLLNEVPNLPQVAGAESQAGVFQLISQLYKLSAEAKVGPVREYMEMLCEDDQLKFLVFAYHHDMMDGIQQTLSERKVKFVRIDGNTRSSDRQVYVNQFQSDPETKVAILSILAAGVGLTLTAAKLVVFAELYWTPGVMIQCEDRAHRIGQTCSLPVHYLVARDTMDEWVWSSVCKKTLVTSTTLTGTTKPLHHVEGESYQVELLSNADVWRPTEDSSDVNVTQLVQSQRPHDQSSILEFFTSQRSPEHSMTRKRKYKLVSQEEKSRMSASASDSHSLRDKNQTLHQVSSDFTKRNQKFALKISEVIAISDDEDEFQPVRKSKKVKRVKKRKQKNEKELRKGQPDIEGGCEVVEVARSKTVPNFNLNFFEDCVSASETSCDGVEDSASVVSEGGVEDGMSEVLHDGLDESGDSSSISDTSLFVSSNKKVEGLPRKTHVSSNIQFSDAQVKDAQVTDTLKDAEFKKIQVSNTQFKDGNKIEHMLCSDDKNHPDQKSLADASIQQSVALSPTCDHSDGVQNGMSATCHGHSCLRDEGKQAVNKAGSSQWPCSVCTFFNHPELPECEMCDTPKKKSAPKKHSDVAQECSHLENDDSTSANNKLASKQHKTSRTVAVDSAHTVNSHQTVDSAQTVDSSHTVDFSQTSDGNDSCLLTKISRSTGRNKLSALFTKATGRSKHSNRVNSSSERPRVRDMEFTTIKIKPDSACCSVNTEGRIQPDVGYKKQDRGSIQTDSYVDTDTTDAELETVLTSQEDTNSLLQVRVVGNVSGYSSDTLDLFKDCEEQAAISDPKAIHSLSNCKDHVQAPDVKTADNSLQLDNARVPSRKPTCASGEASRRLNSLTDGDSDSRIDSFGSKSVHGAASDWSCEPEPHVSCVSASQHKQVLSVPPVHTSAPLVESASRFRPQSITTTTTTGDESSLCPSSASHKRKTDEAGDQMVHSVLKFSCSSHTGRIFVFDENEQFLQVSFQPIDIELGNTDELPQVLQQLPHLRLLQKFVREWNSLTDTKKRLVVKRCQIFTSPLAAYEGIKTIHGSTQRHLNKQDNMKHALSNASKMQGSVRMISRKPKTPANLEAGRKGLADSGVSLPQVVTDSGAPLCLQCQRPVSSPLLSAETISNPDNAWQLRLCSFSCMDKYWTLSKASYCRDQLYEVERGVCQLCRFDTHTLFTHIKVTRSLTARADILMKSPYRTLTQTQRKKMIQEPQAGQFWHADHILPVWQGGGMCDLDNLRTLCTPCHTKVTSRQANQRAAVRKLGGAAGHADITAFFQRS
ncbi:hypothetical protein BsWGS_20074 [Bradybaena similaris]